MRDLVLAMTGASGSLYAMRLLDVLVASGRTVHLTLSPSAQIVLSKEVSLNVSLSDVTWEQLLPDPATLPAEHPLRRVLTDAGRTWLARDPSRPGPLGRVITHHYQNFLCGIASGSFLTGGMVICPCSMGTLAGLAGGLSNNLIHRAADVHLKERRKLIVVPRETPLGSIQLENMKRLVDAGAIVLPAMPGFYHQPRSILDLVDFVVARIADHLDVDHTLMHRWGT